MGAVVTLDDWVVPDGGLGLACRADPDGGRWIAGIAMPWDQPVTIGGRTEEFAPGGLTLRADRPVPLRYGHQSHQEGEPVPVGVVARSVDTDGGLWVEARMLDTPGALNAYAAVEAGLVTGLSVEFSRASGMRGRGGQGRVEDGVGNGVALTERPIYAGARITEVRARTPRLDAVRAWLDERGLA